MSERIDIKTGTNDKGETEVLELRVYYSKGGINYMSYKQEPRGYYVILQPCTIGEGFRTYMISPGSTKGGFKQCIEVTKRLNRKRLEVLQTAVHGINTDLVHNLWATGELRAIFHEVLRIAGIQEVAA